MKQANMSPVWEEHNRHFVDLGRRMPWTCRFRLTSYYLLLDRKTANPAVRVLKILTDLAYAVYFPGKCLLFSVLASRTRFPDGKTLVLLNPGGSNPASLAPVIRELEKRGHGCVYIYNHRIKKRVTGLYGISAGNNSLLFSFEEILFAEGRMRSVKNFAIAMTRAWRDLVLFLGSDLPSRSLIGLHFFVWAFSQHLFSQPCTELLSISRNVVAMNDYFLWESIYYHCAQDLPLETYILQHGVLGPAYNPPLAKKYLLWGEIEGAQFTGPLGCSQDGCLLVGSPKYDDTKEEYDRWKKPVAERKNIVFISSRLSFIPEEYRAEYLNVCEWFFQLSDLENIGEYRFILKVHPFEDIGVYRELMRKYGSGVAVEKGGLFDHLLDARVSISHSSTGIYESLLMEVPSIQVVPEGLPTSIQYWRWGITEKVSTFEEFRDVAVGLMTDDSCFRSAVKKIGPARNRAFVNLGRSSEVIADILQGKVPETGGPEPQARQNMR